MQDLLTLAVEAIATAAAIYFATSFVSIVRAHRPTPAAVELPTAVEPPTVDEVEAVIEELTLVAESLGFEIVVAQPTQSAAAPVELETIEIAVELPLESTAPEWAQLNVAQLHDECNARSIKWRNAHGKGRNLKKLEMVAALENWRGDAIRITA